MSTWWSNRAVGAIPIGMSAGALAVVLSHIAIYGVARQADEGTAAHLWQLLIAGQLPVIALYAATSMGRDPKRTLLMLALQVGAILAAMAPVFFLGL